MVDHIVCAAGPGQDQLADGDHVIALPEEVVQNARQGLRGVQGGVVEEDDGPRPHVGRHPLGDGRRVILLPVQAVHVPLDGFQTHAPDGGDHMVVILAEGRPEEGGPAAGDGLDLVVAGVEVCHDLVGGEGVEVGVVVGVAHHLMARLGQGPDGVGVFLHPLPHHEKGHLHVVAVKNVDEGLGILVAPG